MTTKVCAECLREYSRNFIFWLPDGGGQAGPDDPRGLCPRCWNAAQDAADDARRDAQQYAETPGFSDTALTHLQLKARWLDAKARTGRYPL